MKKLLALAIVGSAFTAYAADFSATLTTAQEAHQAPPAGNPPPRAGSGVGTLTLNGDDFTYDVTFSGLGGNATAAHIHGPAGPGTDAGVLFGITANGGLGGQSGHFFGSVNNITPQQISDLNAGLWYFNVHSSVYGGGEIRGQITAVPEPSTIALAVGAGVMMLALRRKRS